MSDHLPECRRWFTDMPEPDECPACEMFRACEQRVEREWIEHCNRMEARALQAARDAVAATDAPCSGLCECIPQALAAIDALTGDQA